MKNNPLAHTMAALGMLAFTASVCSPAFAQAPAKETGLALEEIIVTARRRNENLQDVPLTVNVVSAEQLADLNLRNFEDISSLVAGLELTEDAIASSATVRGIDFNVLAQFPPSIDFYLNDSPVSPLTLMQAMFDVHQIEVLRGPQGTLRGRSSPSGAITMTTGRPDLGRFGGHIDLTADDNDGRNIRGALNIPVIEDSLAVRIAGFWEENNGNYVESITGADDSKYEGDGYRFSVRWAPTDNFLVDLMHQKIEPERTVLAGVESANRADPSLDPADPALRADDRKSVQDFAEFSTQEMEATILNVAWRMGNHQAIYNYSDLEEQIERTTNEDPTNALNDPSTEVWEGLSQHFDTLAPTESHEFRLQSVEPLFDRLDYVVGAYYSKASGGRTLLNNQTALRIDLLFESSGNLLEGAATQLLELDIVSTSEAKEESFFGSVNYHLGEDTEISFGARHISYESDSLVTLSGVPFSENDSDDSTTIFAASLKHAFSDDLMAYISYGESWRPGPTVIGDTSVVKSDLQESLQFLDAEESDSIELGIKSNWLDDRLLLNATIYHQEFDGYGYRGEEGIYYRSIISDPDTGELIETLGNFNFVSPVPVDVNGIEIEATYLLRENWYVNGLYSYAKGEIDDGEVACNDYLPNDGIPDAPGLTPSLNDVVAAAGDQNLTTCIVDYRSNTAPLWTATLTSEYSIPFGARQAYLRGLWTLYGSSKNDPVNPLDDVDSYNILNLYAGLRDPDNGWEVMLYAKNIADTEEVLSRDSAPGSVTVTTQQVGFPSLEPVPGGGGSVNIPSDYRQVSVTPPREIGINLRYMF